MGGCLSRCAELSERIKISRMKSSFAFLFLFVFIGHFHTAKSQTINWKSLDASKHLLGAGIGWDYSLAFSLGYAYKVGAKAPLLLHANITIPPGNMPFDDFRTRMGAQILVLKKSNFMAALSLNGIYRRYESPLVRLQNLGLEMRGTFGYYKPSWFAAGELGFDKAIFTHFRHSDSFKENILQEARDGWYNPTTGGHFLYGFQGGYSFGQSDITLNIGMVRTQDFKSSPMIPYYLRLGYNFRF